jgi:hypothetical protein
MDNSNFGFSELYSCVLKATYPMEIGKRTIAKGEVVASFDKIMVSQLKEALKIFSANGGWDNRPHVLWETTEEVELTFTQGVFNKEQFSLLNNAKLLEKGDGEEILLNQSEELESDEDGVIECKFAPIQNFFIYDKETGDKLPFTQLDEKRYSIGAPYKEVLVRYDFSYSHGLVKFLVGRRVMDGFLTLEARTRVKDDKTGRNRTGIIKIPKIKIVSDLSLMLGRNASPVVGTFKGIAIPVGARGVHSAMSFYILEDDIDKDTD